MALATTTDVLNTVRLRKALSNMSDSIGLDKLQVIHREVVAMIPGLRQFLHSSPASIDMVSGTKEYAIPAEITQVDYAEYRTAAGITSASELSVTSVEIKNQRESGWRSAATGVPTEYYIVNTPSGPMIGFHPTPNTTKSAGYPIVQLWGSKRESADLALGDALPTALPSLQVYVEGVSWLYALDNHPELAAGLYNYYERQLRICERFLSTKAEQLKDLAVPNSRGGG